MGNSMGKKRNMASAPSKKQKRELYSVSSLTSSNFNHLTVEFPKEIEEDLERRKIESFKALAEGSKKPKRSQSSTGPAAHAPSSDPTRDLYEKMRSLDVPAVMVPKPWSEVDQILAKHKDSFKNGGHASTVTPLRASPKTSPLPEKPNPPAGAVALEEQQPETVDMSELMDDLEEEEGDIEDENDEFDDETAEKSPVLISREQLATSAKPEDFSAKKILALEKSLSFSTIHTIKEFEGGVARPETVASFMTPKYQYGNSNSLKKSNSLSGAITSPTLRKVNVNPNLLARIQAFE